MVFRDKGLPPKGGKYLACSNGLRSSGCDNHRHYRYEEIEQQLLDGIQEIDLSNFNQSAQQEKSKLASELRVVEGALSANRSRLSKLLALVELGGFDDIEEVARRIKGLNSSIKEDEIKLGRLNGLVNKYQHTASGTEYAASIKRLRAEFSSTEGETLFRLRAKLSQEVKAVMKAIIFDPERGQVVILLHRIVKVYRLRDGQMDATSVVYLEKGITVPKGGFLDRVATA